MSTSHTESANSDTLAILPPSAPSAEGISVDELDIETITLTTPPWLEGEFNPLH